MPVKILRVPALRPILLLGAGAVAWLPSGDSRLLTPDSRLPAPVSVRGHLTLLEKGERQAEDVGQAVIWLAPRAPASAAPIRAEISTAEKQFSPHVLVVPVGSTVTFPNHDPFNHNVFSLSEENPFDLGMYGRGATPSVKFERAGIARIYCNVHAQMSALVVVRDNPYYSQPSSDGSFTLDAVPPGRYVLHAWHERSPEKSRDLTVPAGGVESLELELDARGYKFKPHLNKFGRPYPQQGRRY
ncbi:MAG TPA: carboxypeptidase regulatory-like domain-containing protein [Gemmatimonadales bacterium]|nr:carboxypeptidase regulatory-like domain-containing protein [Gemmatimonadales bacterium]